MKKYAQYGFIMKLRMLLWLIRTKLICKNARLIRFPFDIRGKKLIDFGKCLTTGIGCRIEAFEHTESLTPIPTTKKIIFGENVQINDYVHISAMGHVSIGDNVLMASHIYIADNSHGYYKGDENDTNPVIPPIKRPYHISPVSIGKNSWIGEGVFIMPGVTIGEGCIIGAHSVVNRDIPAFCIAVGSPAIPIKKYNFSKKIWEKITK